MNKEFFDGFEKRAGFFDKVREAVTKTFGKAPASVKQTAKQTAKQTVQTPTRNIDRFPRGSVIVKSKKPAARKGAETLDYSKINADVAEAAAKRKQYLREGGATYRYNRMGDPIRVG